MVCLGTVADVIPLVGENRIYVKRGLEALNSHPRPGLAALMAQCGCESGSVTASTIGYMLAPRINAAGRMGKIDAAVELFLTQDPVRGEAAARELCELNRERQAVESEIYRPAMEHLRCHGAVDVQGLPGHVVLEVGAGQGADLPAEFRDILPGDGETSGKLVAAVAFQKA